MPVKTAKIEIEETKIDTIHEEDHSNKLIRIKNEFYGDIYVIAKYLVVCVFFYGLISILQDVQIL